jgi:hypothetical protein
LSELVGEAMVVKYTIMMSNTRYKVNKEIFVGFTLIRIGRHTYRYYGD